MVSAAEIHPPWINDEHPEYWVQLKVAASILRKSTEYVRTLAATGTIPAFHDGYRWWVRLDISPNIP